MPNRIQLSRAKGYRMPAGAVVTLAPFRYWQSVYEQLMDPS